VSVGHLPVFATVALAQVILGVALRRTSPAVLHSKISRLRSLPQHLAGTASSQDVVRAIESAGRRLPGISTCLVRALAADLLLASPARPLRLTIGVRHTPDGFLESHAWVSDRDSVLIGAPCDGFIPIVEWSAS